MRPLGITTTSLAGSRTRAPRSSSWHRFMVIGCAVAGCAAWLMFAGACTSVSKDLGTVSLLYRDARYEAASAWLQQLSLEIASMELRERAKFHYLRGMTAYRLYQYPDAAHELALAASAVAATGDALSDEQRGMLDQTLAEVALSTSYMTSAPSP